MNSACRSCRFPHKNLCVFCPHLPGYGNLTFSLQYSASNLRHRILFPGFRDRLRAHCHHDPGGRISILSQLSASVTSMVQAGLITKESALTEMKSMGRELGAFSRLEPAGIRPGLLLSFPRMRNLPRSHFNLYDVPACPLSNMYGRLVFIFCSPQKHLPKPPFIVYDCLSYCSVSTYRSLFPARPFWLLLGGDPIACAE